MESSPLNSVMAGILPAFRKPSETCQRHGCRNALQFPVSPAGTKCLVANSLVMRSAAVVAAWRASRGYFNGWQADLFKDFSSDFVFPADAVAYPWPEFLRRRPYDPSGQLDPGDAGGVRLLESVEQLDAGNNFAKRPAPNFLSA